MISGRGYQGLGPLCVSRPSGRGVAPPSQALSFWYARAPPPRWMGTASPRDCACAFSAHSSTGRETEGKSR